VCTTRLVFRSTPSTVLLPIAETNIALARDVHRKMIDAARHPGAG